jgi:hypothetical protein
MKKIYRNLVLEEASPPPDNELVLLTACDIKYLDFAVRFVYSVEAFSPKSNVLLHIINPTDQELQRLAKLRLSLSQTRLFMSYELVDLTAFTLEQRRVYYTCVRFLYLPDLMQKWKNDFLVLDSDALVINPVKAPFSQERNAQIILLRRDLSEKQIPEHLAVAASTVWLHNEPVVRDFTVQLSTELKSALESGGVGWFMDQRILGNLVHKWDNVVKVGNIDKRYIDWTFSADSFIWQAKGERKRNDPHFLMLSQILSESKAETQKKVSSFRKLLNKFDHSHRPVVILLPRLDLSWKKPTNSSISPVAEDVLDLRMYWVRFVTKLAYACEIAGASVEIKQIPLWDIDRRLVDSLDANLVLVPHRCSIDFEAGLTPVLFYMQEYFRWMFVVDPQGWSAASSVYPISQEFTESNEIPSSYQYYRTKLADGDMPSKFAQPRAHRITSNKFNKVWHGIKSLFYRVCGSLQSLPAGKISKVFFPLQIRHDQSIQYFSDYAFDDVLHSIVEWGRMKGVEIHLKPHPANPKLMQKYISCYPQTSLLLWRDENIHDLIDECDAVFVVNSGVGFEALLHAKPIVMFGRAEYDCVAIRAKLDDIDTAWDECQASDSAQLLKKYSQFFNWFTTEYAVDMSRGDICDRRLNSIASQIVTIVKRQIHNEI